MTIQPDHLTPKEAYLAMYDFLVEYYNLTKYDGIGSLLGGLSLLEDGGPADRALQIAWEESIQRAKDGKVNARLTLE